MRSTAQTIYQVSVQAVGPINALRKREPFVVFFSNLSRAVSTLTGQLALNGWPAEVNYTAVYRSLKLRGVYHHEFAVGGVNMLRISIMPQTLNPTLTTLGIDEKPM
jgi:hypothetical protein